MITIGMCPPRPGWDKRPQGLMRWCSMKKYSKSQTLNPPPPPTTFFHSQHFISLTTPPPPTQQPERLYAVIVPYMGTQENYFGSGFLIFKIGAICFFGEMSHQGNFGKLKTFLCLK